MLGLLLGEATREGHSGDALEAQWSPSLLGPHSLPALEPTGRVKNPILKKKKKNPTLSPSPNRMEQEGCGAENHCLSHPKTQVSM